MIIYLEGPDGSGKSTLADTVLSVTSEVVDNVIRNGESYISTNPTRPNRVTKGLLTKRFKMMANSKNVYILDRGPLSDIVYRTFDEYEPIMTFNEFSTLLSKFKNRVLIINCKNKNAEKNMLARGDDNPVAIQKHREITKVYNMLMDSIKPIMGYNFIEYDFSNKLSVNNVIGFTTYFVSMLNGVKR